jgi:hypothetical protein
VNLGGEFMLSEVDQLSDRKRINVSLTEQEYEHLELISSYLGTKPTKLMYMAYMEGLPIIYQRNAALISHTIQEKQNEKPVTKKKR